MLTASCLVMLPTSFASFKNSWNLYNHNKENILWKYGNSIKFYWAISVSFRAVENMIMKRDEVIWTPTILRLKWILTKFTPSVDSADKSMSKEWLSNLFQTEVWFYNSSSSKSWTHQQNQESNHNVKTGRLALEFTQLSSFCLWSSSPLQDNKQKNAKTQNEKENYVSSTCSPSFYN